MARREIAPEVFLGGAPLFKALDVATLTTLAMAPREASGFDDEFQEFDVGGPAEGVMRLTECAGHFRRWVAAAPIGLTRCSCRATVVDVAAMRVTAFDFSQREIGGLPPN